jgi:hypothetical protein
MFTTSIPTVALGTAIYSLLDTFAPFTVTLPLNMISIPPVVITGI